MDGRCQACGIVEDAGVDWHDGEAHDEDWVVLGRWPSAGVAHEYALVVLAMGMECGVFENDHEYVVRADAADARAIFDEWRLYQEETAAAGVEKPVLESRGFPIRLDVTMAWVLLLLAVYWAQVRDPVVSDRFCNSSHGVMIDGEFWRPFTAMFLHADAAHLLGNVLIGGVFLLFVVQAVGAVRGGLLGLGCGTLANAVNAALQMPDAFFSLGASTATFGALGILVGHATREAWMMRSFQGFRMLFVPLVAGGILLGWFGGGGADAGNIDVAGHVLGWFFGVVAGFLFGNPVMVHPERASILEGPSQGGIDGAS